MPSLDESVPKHGDHNHIVVVLPNGVRASIISDGYGRNGMPYEVLFEDSEGRAIDLTPFGGMADGIIGWLSPAALGSLLSRVGNAVVEVATPEVW